MTPSRGTGRDGWSGLASSAAARWWLGIVCGMLAVAAVAASAMIMHRQDTLGSMGRYNATWMCGQAATELARLQAAVGASAFPETGMDAAGVQLRFDILVSRIALLQQGTSGGLLRADAELHVLSAELARVVPGMRNLIDHLAEPGVRPKLLALLAPYNARLQRVAARIYGQDVERVGDDLTHLRHLYWVFSCLLVVLFALAFGLSFLVIWNNRMLHAAYAEVGSLVASLRRTSGDLAAANAQVRDAMADAQRQVARLEERDAALNQQNTRFDAALNNMSQALCMVDSERRLIVCNVRFRELFAITAEAVQPGTPIEQVVRSIATSSSYDPGLVADVALEQLGPESKARTFHRESGDGRALAVSHRPMPGGGWVATYEDVTEQRMVEARIRHMALHDALTGLPNRRLFRDRMEQALQNVGHGIAVLCLDLDQFKTVNDTLGHPAGDALLCEVTRRLCDSVRSSDLVARLGGDEFAILQTSVRQPEHAEALATRLVQVMKAPFDLGGQHAMIGVSVGIAIAVPPKETLAEETLAKETLAGGTIDGVAGTGDISPDTLLKNADLALYQAKGAGRGTYRVFAAEMDLAMQARRTIELKLRAAVRDQALRVEFQPLLDLPTLQPCGFEALLRWHDPELGSVSPAQFIPVAEELGLIAELGRWVLHEACGEAVRWPSHLRVAVNLSPMQFANPGLQDAVLDALRGSGLAPSQLELEITESALLGDSEGVLATLRALRRHGVRTALDDFGTGYSALSYLRQFPFDKIKIDRSFIRDLDTRPDCLAIVTAIIDLAAKLGMTTTAEGVETAEQLATLRAAGCGEVQGYYFARPAPIADLAHWLLPLPDEGVVPGRPGQHPPAHSRSPMDMMSHG